MLLVFIVALVVAVARCITTFIVTAVAVTVLFAFSIAGRPLFAAYLGAVPLLAVRTIAIFFFVAAFVIFATFLMGETVFLIGR